jgi:hypothetical protein
VKIEAPVQNHWKECNLLPISRCLEALKLLLVVGPNAVRKLYVYEQVERLVLSVRKQCVEIEASV